LRPLRAFLVAAAMAALAAAPAAEAAVRITGLAVPTGPVAPEVSNPPVTLDVVVDCASVWNRSPGGGAAVVQVAWTAPAGVTLSGPTALGTPQMGCPSPSGTTNVTGLFRLRIARSAPGLVALPVSVKVDLAGTPVAPALENGTSDQRNVSVMADYYAVNQATVDQRLHECSPCKDVVVHVVVSNLGNANTTYTLQWSNRPGTGWNATLPGPIRAEAPKPGAFVQAMPGMSMPGDGPGPPIPVPVGFDVHVSGAGGEAGFTLVLKPAATADPSKTGAPLSVEFMVRDTGQASHKSPGLPPLAVLGVLALAGLALRRRRRA
jgi:MYXO-CTERM domain-containing protein